MLQPNKNRVLIFCAFMLVLILSPQFAYKVYAQNDITEGNDYWFAIPNCKIAVGESVRWSEAGSPILIWVSSKYATTFTIKSQDGSTVPPQTYSISPGIIKQINLSADVMLSDNDNELPTWKGIHIISKDPVAVGVFVAYKWSGEAFRVIPADWLGQEYYTANLWQDKVLMESGSYPELKPGEIVVVASSEGITNIEYTPKVSTNSVAKGITKSISLHQGQTYLIQAKTDDAISWNTERSDLTGSYLRGNKPFAVISGHTKGAYPQYPYSIYRIKADYIRNMLVEMILPTIHLAKEYISAPFRYLSRVYYNSVLNERGDLIRFVAVENNTIIQEGKYNKTTKKMEYINITNTLSAGDYFDIPNRETPGYYISNKKFLVAQIGKSWIDRFTVKASEGNNEKHGDGEIMNPSQTGQGMMIVLAPIEKWCSYASFKLIENMTGNFVYLTFRASDQNKLFFDGKRFSTFFGNSTTLIQGTPYAYVVQAVSPGDHTVTGADGATFAGYCYGNYDSFKDGFAYGYPIGMNFATICADTLVAKDTVICDSIPGHCQLFYKGAGDSSCLGYLSVSLSESDTSNVDYYPLTPITDVLRDFRFYFKVRDLNLPSYAKLVFRTRSGRSMTKEYYYKPSILSLNNNTMSFGSIKPGSKDSCQTLEIRNYNTIPLTIKSINKLGQNDVFSIDLSGVTFPLPLPPSGTKELTICAAPKAFASEPIRDTIQIIGNCSSIEAYLSVNTPILRINLTDLSFDHIKINTRSVKTFWLNNTGNADLTIGELHCTNKSNGAFIPDTAGLFPMVIKAGESKPISVEFHPTEPGVYSDSAWVITDVSESKSYSIWDGIAYDDTTEAESETIQEKIEIVPNPTGNEFQIMINVREDNSSISVNLFDVLGNCISSIYEGKSEHGQLSFKCSAQDLYLPSGKYILKVTQNGDTQTKYLIITK